MWRPGLEGRIISKRTIRVICYEQRARRGDGAIDVFDEDEKFISGG